jgi:hypothetical protein
MKINISRYYIVEIPAQNDVILHLGVSRENNFTFLFKSIFDPLANERVIGESALRLPIQR